MGKAKQLKKLRRQGRMLPEMDKQGMVGFELIKGEDLDEAQQAEIEDFDASKTYKRTLVGPMPVDHGRELKKMYKKYGDAGTAAYTKAILNRASQAAQPA